MNVELKFKPGVRTSLNSGNNIRDNFGSDNKKAGVTQSRNSAASSAAQNLSGMTLQSGNWNSKSGSILNNNTPARTANNRTYTGTTASSTRSPQQGQRIDQNYVSAGRTQAYTQNRYQGIGDFGYTRADNMTGYSSRSMQRLQDAAYGQGAYQVLNTYAQLNNVQATQASDPVVTAVSVTDVIKTGLEFGKGIWDAFSSTKDSKTSGGGASVSETATTNIKNMQGAKDSATLGSAIDTSKADKTAAEGTVKTLNAELTKAQDAKPGLEKTLTEKTKAHDDLNTQITTLTSETGQLKTGIESNENKLGSLQDKLKNAPEEEKSKIQADIDALESQIEAQKKTLQEKEAKLAECKKQLPTAKGEMEDAQKAVDANKKIIDETPAKIKDAEATVEAYDKEIPKQEKRLTEMQNKEDKEFAKLAEKPNDKIKDKDKTKRNDLAKNIASRSDSDNNTFEEIGGHSFAKIACANGETKFLIDGVLKDEAEFNTEMEKAKNPATVAEDAQ